MLQTVVNASMDCSGRSNNDVERETDLVEDLSHEEHSDEEMRDCDSIEGQHSNISAAALAARTANGRLNNHNQNNQNHNNSGCGLTGGDIATYTGNNNSGVGVGGLIGNSSRSPDTPTDIQMNHHHRFSTSHPLNALGNFMGIGGLHGLPNMSHDDVLEKLKMQVREMKAGLMEQDYAAAHAAAFGAPMNTAFSLPPTSMASFGHPPQSMSSAQTHNSLSNGTSNVSANTQCALATPVSLANGNSGTTTGANNVPFSFTSPTAPNNTKDVNLASNSSTSSEASNSSQQNNGWSFEEQYKQVRQLYEINDDPKRKEFLDDLFAFMQKRGTPINRLPIMAKSVLDLFELYNLVIARGGLVDVINKKLWQEIIKGLHLPSSITSAAFTLRTQYMKFLYPYECEKKNLSSPSELQAAIDGNRREGRRSSYGQYDTMHSPLQMQMTRQNMSGGMQQMSPLALVTHAAAANNQQAAAAAAAAAHHRLMAPNFGQVPNLMTAELEQRMMEYLKLIQVKKEQQNAAVAAAAAAAGGAGSGAGTNGMSLSQHGLQHQSGHAQQRQRSQSPEMTQRDALSALEMSRVALWQMYHNNTSPPASVGASPQSAAAVAAAAVALANNHSAEAQREALNLSDSPPNVANIKRERDRDGSPEPCDEFNHQPPAAKRAPVMPAFPGGFWPPGMAAAAAAANFHQSVNTNHDSDMEADGEHEEADDEGEHNTTVNSNNSMEGNNERQLNGHHHDLHHHLHNNHHLMHAHNHALHHHNNHISLHHSDNKSDDSAIEHSPTTSGGSASGATAAGCAASLNTNADDDGNISPVSTKKIHLNKQGKSTERHKSLAGSDKNIFDAINLFSSLQFNVKHHGVTVNGEPQLYVNLQLNGIKYSGTLLGKAPVEQSNSTTMLAKVISDVNSKSADSNINLSGDNTKPLNEDVETMKVVEEITVDARKDVAPVTIGANNETSTVNLNNNNNNNKKSTTDIINEQTETTATEVESVAINAETPTTTTATTIQTSQNMHDAELVNEDLEEEEEEDDDEEIHSHGNSSRCSSPPRPVIM